MDKRGELEAALAASWDHDTLAVYADHLQAEGDPRGELIMLDLEIASRGNTLELSRRRTSLLYAWVGALVPADNVHASWVGDTFLFGFIDELAYVGGEPNALARFEQVLASPAAPYIRGLRLTGTTHELELAAQALATRRHAWLHRCSIGLSEWTPPQIAPEIAHRLFEAMPHLESLELRHYPALGPFSHPTIKRLAIAGLDAYTALGEGAAFDAVTELAIQLSPRVDETTWSDPWGDEIDPEPPAAIELPAVAFPALRSLDLGRNLGAVDETFAILRQIASRSTVTHLRLPQLRNADDRELLVAACRDLPALEVVEIVHGHYYQPRALANAKLVCAESWPWPTQEQARERALRIFMPQAKYGETVTILDAVHVMEQRFERLPQPTREAWSQLWKVVAQAASGTFSAKLLAEAVDAVPELMVNGWRELREELAARRPLSDAAQVRIEACST